MRKKIKIKILGFVCIFLCANLFSSLGNLEFQDSNIYINPESSTNTLYANKDYPFHLDDYYDDNDLSHIYTGANFQKTYIPTDTQYNESVDYVNNSEIYDTSLGDYPATHSFNEYVDGTEGYDITGYMDYYSAGAGCSGTIISEFDDHNKVLQLEDQNPAGYVATRHNFDYIEEDATIEYWLTANISNVGYRGLYAYIYDQNAVFIISLLLSGTSLRYYNGTSDYTLSTFTVNEFLHIKMVLDDTADTYDVYVDGFLKETDINYINPSTTPAYRTYFATRSSNTGYKIFIDALGYSGDPEYIPSGHHRGPYSFTEDTIGGNPVGWTLNEAGGTINVIEEKDGHEKVLEFHDTSITQSISARNDFTLQSDGTIEFWWAFWANVTYTNYLYIRIYEGGVERIRTIYSYQAVGQIQNHNGASYEPIETGLSIDTFYHIKYVFDDTANTFNYYINGVDYGVFNYYTNSIVGVDRIIMSTRSNGKDYYHWIDAFGLSGDIYYTIGDNLLLTTGNTIPIGLEMVKGTYDNTNNLLEDDNNYSVFTGDGGTTYDYAYDSPSQWGEFDFTKGSGTTAQDILSNNGVYSTLTSSTYIPISDGDPEYIDSTSYVWGSDGPGTFENTHTDDTNYKALIGQNVYSSSFILEVEFVFDPVVGGRDFYISGDMVLNSLSPSQYELRINGVAWKTGTTIDFDNELRTGVNSITYRAMGYSYMDLKVNYFKLEEKDATPEVSAKFDYTITWIFPSGTAQTLFYDYMTSVAVDCDLDIYDWVAGSYNVELESNTGTGYITDSYDLEANPNKVSGSNQVRVRFQTAGYSNNFYMYIDQLTTYYNTPAYSFNYIITWTVPTGTVLTFLYDYRTSVAVDCDLDIYDWVAGSYNVELESNTGTGYITDSYDLEANPNKVSGSNQVRVRFQTAGYSNNFYMYIDQLTTYYNTPTYKFDYVITWIIPTGTAQTLFYDYTTVIEMSLDCDLDIYDWVSTSYVELESNTEPNWITDSYDLASNPNKVSGSNQVRVRFQTASYPENFLMYIDQLAVYYNTPTYSFNYITTWIIPTGTAQTLFYDYMTSVAVDCDLDIYDWDSTSYVQLQSNTGTGYITDSYDLEANPNKVSGSNQVRVRFQTAGYSNNFYMYIDQLTTYYEVPTTTYSFNYEMTWTFPSGTAQSFLYDYRTSVAVDCDLDIWDWVAGSYNVELESNTGTGYITDSYDLEANPNKVSGSNQVRVRFQTASHTSNFYMYIDQLTTYYNTPTYKFDYITTWIFPSGTAQTLFYDYMTSVAVDCDLDIWDWVAGSYNVELESNTGTGYITDSYDLEANPNKVSGSNQVRVRFQTASHTSNFYMYIDQLTTYYEIEIPDNSELEFTIQSPNFSNYERDDLLALRIISNHFTSLSITTTTKIWNDYTDTWIQLWSATRTSEYQETYTITSNIDQYFDGDGKIKLQYLTYHASLVHTLSIDYVQFLLTDKLDLVHTTSFDLVGSWKYRWEVLGSLYYTSWVSFEVISMPPNFEAISESEYTTRWILQNSTIIAVEDFHDDINTDYWNLIDISTPNFTYSVIPTGDSATRQISPDTNFGSGTYIEVVGSGGSYKQRSYTYFSDILTDYLFENQSGNNEVGLYASYVDNWDNDDLQCYNISSFIENIITWNTQPAPDTLQDSLIISSTGYNYFDISDLGGYYAFKWSDETTGRVDFRSKESAYDPIFRRVDVHKNYFGDGYMYMQTDTTELISLKSQDYGAHKTLLSGDYFEVDLQTSSDSQINLILYKNGAINKTLILSSSGNTNFNRRTVKIAVSEVLEFDQLKIQSTFEDTDYIKVYDIKTYKYGDAGDITNMLVGSMRTKGIYLTPSSTPYNMRIYELIGVGEFERVNQNITIPETGQFQYVYVPTLKQECRVGLTSMQDVHFEFTDYSVYINRSIDGYFNYVPLLEPFFQADIGTMVYFNVYDQFGSLINSYEKQVADFINIQLEVFQLQIKNLQEQKTTININGTLSFPLLSGDSIYFRLKEAHYQIGYIDPNNVDKSFNIYLDSNQAYELNRSKMCFLTYTNQRGEYLSFNNYKTYLNGSLLYYNVFYKEVGDFVNITIRDHYEYDISETIYAVNSGDNYIPIILTMYSLKVMSQQLCFNHINITRDPNYYESDYYWSEWIAPNEIIEFKLFAGYYRINLTDTENGGGSEYGYELNGDDVLLLSSDNTIFNILYNIANVNTTIGNQITYICVNLTNQNSQINNSIVFLTVNIENLNSSLGNLLVDMDFSLTNIGNDISSLSVFTNNSFINLDNQINTSFIYMENNLISINQTVSTLVLGIDNSISILNGTVTIMFTEMNQQFIVTQTSIDFSFTSLNQSIVQLANNISTNQVVLYNLIELRANDIDDNIINIQTLINLLNSSVANESLVIQTLVNIIGNNLTENHLIINNLINLLGNNITENNLQLISILELIGNNISTNHFVLQTLIDVIGNNISSNHFELLTNLNIINSTLGQNQIELINRILLINSTINDLVLELTNQILFVNDTIYTAVLDLSTSVEFGVDVILGNISITYQQNDFLTELYKTTMFSQLLNWSDVAYNYTLMEDRIDVWDFINNYKNDSITVFLRYGDLIDNLTISAQNTIEQFLPATDVEYRLWSVANEEYLDEWKPLPENKTVSFGFYETDIIAEPFDGTILMIVFGAFVIATVGYLILLRTNLRFQKRNLFSVQKKPMKKVNLNKNLTDKSWKKDLESET